MSDLYKIDRERRLVEQAITDEACKYTYLIPDDIGRAAIETLSRELYDMSKGRNEVRWDKEGHPHIMVKYFCDEKARLDYLSLDNSIFNASDTTLATDVHPAFRIDNALIAGFRLSKYLMPRFKGRNICASLYNMAPAFSAGGFTASTNGCVEEIARINALSGDGDVIHLETLAEYAYLGLLASRRAFQCHGNTSYGKYHGDSSEKAAPAPYLYQDKRECQTRTGTGPLSWMSDGSPFGVADLVGSMVEWVTGFKMNDEELQFIPYNGAAKEGLSSADLLASSTLFKGLLQDGTFVAPGTDGTYKYDFPSADSASYSKFVLATTSEHQIAQYGSVASADLTARDGVTVATYLRLLGLFPTLKNVPSGTKYIYPSGARAVGCGGYWGSSGSAGLGYVGGSFGNSSGGCGARSASIIKNNS